MAVFIGASPEDLEVFAGVLDTQASALVDISGRVSGQLSVAAWAGADMEHFSDRWTNQLSGQLHRAAALLVHGAQSVRAQAEQQRRASSAAGPTGSGRGGPSLGAWESTRGDGPRSRTGPSGEDVRTGWSVYDGVKTMLRETPGRIEAARDFFRSRSEVAAALQLWKQTRNYEDAALRGVLRQVGDPRDYRVLRQWFTGRENIGQALDQVVGKAGTFWEARGGLIRAVEVVRPAGRVLTGLGVGFGLLDVVDPSHDGVHGALDRTSGALSAGAGLYLLAAGASLTPPGAIIAGSVLAVTAAYSLGSLAYDHRAQIAHGAAVAADWVGDRASDAAGWVGDKASDAGKAVGDKVSGAGKAVGHKVSGAWHAAKGLF